jgi:hypothetical protein
MGAPPATPRFYWRVQPFKSLYIIIYGSSILLRIPYWLLAAIVRRPRPGWTIKQTFIVRFFRHFQALATRVDFRLDRNLLDEVKPESLKASRHVWVPAVAADRVTGYVGRLAQINNGASGSLGALARS